MPAAEPPIVSTESGLVKMDDRKRPAADSNDSAPPSKKQATAVNGGSKPHPDADMPWKDDLEVCDTQSFSLAYCVMRTTFRAQTPGMCH